jgi:small secreted domain DUF320
MGVRRKFTPSPAMAVSLVALVVAVGGVAVAAIPGPDGVIHACIADGNLVTQVGAALAPTTQLVSPKGALRVIDAGESCGAGETPLNFNQTGPPGPAASGGGPQTIYSERTAKGETIGAKSATVFSAILPAGSYDVIGNLHFVQPHALKADQRAECWVTGPSKRVITDSTVSQTLAAGGGEDATNLAIDTVVADMPEGTVSVICEDIPSPGAVVARSAVARVADAAAEGEAVASPGVLSGNLVQVPVHIPVNVCGDTIDVIGLLNPASANTCVDH